MGILIITTISLIISYIIYKITKLDCFGFISAASTLVLVASILIIGLSHAFSYIDVINYQNDKIKIETAINNPQITGEERASVIDIITKDNIYIISNRFYGQSFWTNIFFPKNVQQLELFDINKISYANTKVIK